MAAVVPAAGRQPHRISRVAWVAGQRPALPRASPQPSAVAPCGPSGYGPGLFCRTGLPHVTTQSPSHRPGPGPDSRRRCPRR
ncbi:hypothetical protein PEM_18070 [Stenotrophomonas sp. Pemsol]|nr:hypothetical protein PEM_18070 [Stenotrophomonas sp. Pemsol]